MTPAPFAPFPQQPQQPQQPHGILGQVYSQHPPIATSAVSFDTFRWCQSEPPTPLELPDFTRSDAMARPQSSQLSAPTTPAIFGFPSSLSSTGQYMGAMPISQCPPTQQHTQQQTQNEPSLTLMQQLPPAAPPQQAPQPVPNSQVQEQNCPAVQPTQPEHQQSNGMPQAPQWQPQRRASLTDDPPLFSSSERQRRSMLRQLEMTQASN